MKKIVAWMFGIWGISLAASVFSASLPDKQCRLPETQKNSFEVQNPVNTNDLRGTLFSHLLVLTNDFNGEGFRLCQFCFSEADLTSEEVVKVLTGLQALINKEYTVEELFKHWEPSVEDNQALYKYMNTERYRDRVSDAQDVYYFFLYDNDCPVWRTTNLNCPLQGQSFSSVRELSDFANDYPYCSFNEYFELFKTTQDSHIIQAFVNIINLRIEVVREQLRKNPDDSLSLKAKAQYLKTGFPSVMQEYEKIKTEL